MHTQLPQIDIDIEPTDKVRVSISTYMYASPQQVFDMLLLFPIVLYM
jgi:hypothetical protein